MINRILTAIMLHNINAIAYRRRLLSIFEKYEKAGGPVTFNAAILRFGIALNQAAIDAVKGWIR